MYPDPDASNRATQPRADEFETWRSTPDPPTMPYQPAGPPIMRYDWEIQPGERHRAELRRSRVAISTAVGLAVAVAGAVFLAIPDGGSPRAVSRRPPARHAAAMTTPTGAPTPSISPILPPRPSPSVKPSTHSVPVTNHRGTSHDQPAQVTPNRPAVRRPPVVHHHPRPRMCPVKDNGVVVAYVPC